LNGNVRCRKGGIEGRVDVNGAERKFKTFRKQSAYITQQDHLLQNLTVDEYMTSAAHLKMGNNASEKEKKLTVSQLVFILSRLCSEEKYDLMII
jgi:ABC-type multidrug transport system ATPase subunit